MIGTRALGSPAGTRPVRLVTVNGRYDELALAGLSRESEAPASWTATLPARLETLDRLWHFASLEPLVHTGHCSWIGACALRDGASGVLKLAFPHPEGRDEILALEVCDGEPTVRLLRAHRDLDAMLLERLRPGHPLSNRPESEQDPVIGDLLRRLHRVPPAPRAFRPLAELVGLWRDSTLDPDGGDARGPRLVAHGLAEFESLLDTSPEPRLLATDLHAGNVLAATREPWLAIDPKPFAGDTAFDVTQHLLNCPTRLRADPDRTIAVVSKAAGVDADRARRWLFARLAAEPGRDDAPPSIELVRRSAPRDLIS